MRFDPDYEHLPEWGDTPMEERHRIWREYEQSPKVVRDWRVLLFGAFGGTLLLLSMIVPMELANSVPPRLSPMMAALLAGLATGLSFGVFALGTLPVMRMAFRRHLRDMQKRPDARDGG